MIYVWICKVCILYLGLILCTTTYRIYKKAKLPNLQNCMIMTRLLAMLVGFCMCLRSQFFLAVAPRHSSFLWAEVFCPPWLLYFLPPVRQKLILRSSTLCPAPVVSATASALGLLVVATQPESRQLTKGDLGSKAASTKSQLESYKICFHPGVWAVSQWCFWNRWRA